MSKVDIINEIDILESALVNLLISKQLVYKSHVNICADIQVIHDKIVKTINLINAYYVLLNSK